MSLTQLTSELPSKHLKTLHYSDGQILLLHVYKREGGVVGWKSGSPPNRYPLKTYLGNILPNVLLRKERNSKEVINTRP